MMKGIINNRVAALALAASALITPAALADNHKRSGVSISIGTDRGAFVYQTGHTGHVYDGRYHQSRHYSGHRYYGRRGLNEFGQTRREVRERRRTAIQACRQAIRSEAGFLGFRDVDFDDGRRARQIGPRGFVITFNEVEFETRRREIERPIRCTVRRGTRVTQLEGIPQRRGRRYRNSQHVW
ncbi:MAG: hypothetical protein AAGH90_11455 [Pseudomonadota bacterium]